MAGGTGCNASPPLRRFRRASASKASMASKLLLPSASRASLASASASALARTSAPAVAGVLALARTWLELGLRVGGGVGVGEKVG